MGMFLLLFLEILFQREWSFDVKRVIICQYHIFKMDIS